MNCLPNNHEVVRIAIKVFHGQHLQKLCGFKRFTNGYNWKQLDWMLGMRSLKFQCCLPSVQHLTWRNSEYQLLCAKVIPLMGFQSILPMDYTWMMIHQRQFLVHLLQLQFQLPHAYLISGWHWHWIHLLRWRKEKLCWLNFQKKITLTLYWLEKTFHLDWPCAIHLHLKQFDGMEHWHFRENGLIPEVLWSSMIMCSWTNACRV